MFKKSIFLFLCSFLLATSAAFSQESNIVSVNPYTGTANVVIPIYTFKKGAVTFPIYLSYSATGVKVKDVEDNAGIGWHLSAGGKITRTVRGLPDDCQLDDYGNTALGWLHNTNAAKINSFSIANTNNSCTNEATDKSYINSNFSDLSDTEPDLFNINVPGLACQFVFDGSQNIKTIPYKDLQITYTTDASGRINSFTVVNDMGIKYVFSITESVKRQTVTTTPANINYFKTDYNQYKNGITYNESWDLYSITDSNGNGMVMNYTAQDEAVNVNPLVLIIGGPSGTTSKVFEYNVSEKHLAPQLLSHVGSIKDDLGVSLSYVQNIGMQTNYVTGINILGERYISFGYDLLSMYEDPVGYGSTDYRRYVLTSLIGANPTDYKFAYTGVGPYDNPPTALPDSTTKQIDYWGYYSNTVSNTSLTPAVYINPSTASLQRYKIQGSTTAGTAYTYSLTGASRAVDPTNVMAGTLNQITYSSGGTTSLTYESNDYYDSSTSTVIKGGGIRVKSIVDYDGIDVTKNIVRNYSYIDPSTSLSSGKPITLPIYAFTTAYGGTGTPQVLWNYSTVRSETDLSSEDESIVYSKVKVSQSGAGNTLYQYAIPATNWDMSVLPDWAPTIDYIARANCSATTYTKNDIYSYPFAPNTNYDFERGLLTQVTNYTDAGQEVSESDYTYTRSAAPIAINALRIDYNNLDLAYSKYSIFTTCSELTTQVINKIFDSQTFTLQQTSTENYTYGSMQHKKPTLISATNSDGSVHSEKIAYIKDFTIPTTTDQNLLTMKGLQQINVNIPVETQYQVQRSGTTKTVGAELNTFNTITGTNGPLYLLNQKLAFVSSNGVTDFAPAAISSGVFTKDSRYIVKENDTYYDGSGFLLTKDDNHKNVQTVLTDHSISLPVAVANNAAWNEMAFTNFESAWLQGLNGISFGITTGTYTYSSTARTGIEALTLKVGDVLTADSLQKSAKTNNYVFSCWVNSSAVATLNVATNIGGTITTYTIAIPNGSGQWKYYQRVIPVASAATVYSVTVSSTAQIIVDDMLYYPDVASVMTYTYDQGHQKISETNTNGVSTYYSYDQYGRVLFVYDQDKQIVLKKTYLKYADYVAPQPLIVANFGVSYYSQNAWTNRQIIYTNTSSVDPSVTDIVYTWNYGDGSSVETNTNGSHTYTTAGTYTVTLTATSAAHGVFTSTQTITITALPTATLRVLYSNLSSGGSIQNVQFSQNGQPAYVVPGTTLATGTFKIVPDRYDIIVTVNGTTSNYNSVIYNGTSESCTGYSSTHKYNYSDDLRNTSQITFTIDINTCGGTTQHP